MDQKPLPDLAPAPPNPGCPPGLEYLTLVDQLVIKQKVELLEILVDFETQNKYEVVNSLGQRVYLAAEISGCCMRNFCGRNRGFEMAIVDNFGQEVVHVERPLHCNVCCCLCLQEMTVYAPPGLEIGKIKQLCTCLRPKFAILDHVGNEVLYVRGPICVWDCCCDDKFKVLALDGETEVGLVSKQWSGLLKEAFTDADVFGVSFPVDLDVRVKATLMAVAFLIDFMYYEKTKADEDVVSINHD